MSSPDKNKVIIPFSLYANQGQMHGFADNLFKIRRNTYIKPWFKWLNGLGWLIGKHIFTQKDRLQRRKG